MQIARNLSTLGNTLISNKKKTAKQRAVLPNIKWYMWRSLEHEEAPLRINGQSTGGKGSV